MNDKPQRYAIVGMKHRKAEGLVASLPNDEPVVFVREPGNRFDANAVQVWARGQHVGYVSKDQNKVLAQFIDSMGEASVPLAFDSAAQPTSHGLGKMLKGRLHKGNNTWPLVEVV